TRPRGTPRRPVRRGPPATTTGDAVSARRPPRWCRALWSLHLRSGIREQRDVVVEHPRDGERRGRHGGGERGVVLQQGGGATLDGGDLAGQRVGLGLLQGGGVTVADDNVGTGELVGLLGADLEEELVGALRGLGDEVRGAEAEVVQE